MREIKFKMLVEWENKKREWLYYGINSKPFCAGGVVIAQDLQFTGLLDKNGKEIYEGDIVSHSEWAAGSPQEKKYPKKNGVVVWEPKQGWVFESRPLWSIAIYDTNEVIGNIHENPEALKEGGGK